MDKIREALEDGLRLQKKYYGYATELHLAMIDWAKVARYALAHPQPEAQGEEP